MSKFIRIPMLVASAVAFALACDDDEDSVSPGAVVTVAAANASVSAMAGSPATTTIIVTRSGTFNGAVSLTATGMPAGVTASFEPQFVADTGTTSTLTLAALATNPPSTSMITLKATGTGVAPGTAQVQFTVIDNPAAVRRP